MLHCDLRVRWKVASDLRFRAALSEPKTPSFCGISGDLAPSTRKSLAIAIVRFWCAKGRNINPFFFWGGFPSQPQSIAQKGVHVRPLTAPGARTPVSEAFEPFSSREFRASIARTPFCAILWRSPENYYKIIMSAIIFRGS